jgi:hypothetical protein
MKLQIKNENGLAVATSPTGLKIIAYAYGTQCGTANINPVTSNDTVTIYTALQECDVNGAPVDSKKIASEYTVRLSVSDLAGIPIWGEDGFSPEVVAVYVDKLVDMTSPVEE